MTKLCWRIMPLIYLATTVGCGSGREVELARLKAETARAEAETAKAELERTKMEASATQEEANRDEAHRQTLGPQAVAFVERNAPQILSQAYPLAFEKLSYRNAELLGIGESGGGYVATVRLNYLNLFRRPHYLDIAFSYDSRGGYRSWAFSSYSDIVAPGELTASTLLELAK